MAVLNGNAVLLGRGRYGHQSWRGRGRGGRGAAGVGAV